MRIFKRLLVDCYRIDWFT